MKSKMKSKFMLSVAATAALLMASPGLDKAEAAEQYNKENNHVYVYQSGNLSQNDINQLWQKYFKGFNWTSVQQPTQVQQPSTPVKQQPAQQPAKEQPAKPAETTPASSEVSAFEQKVVELTNQERAKHGLSALKLDTELSKVAKVKSQDMKNKGYFSHTSPTYGSPFDMMKQFGISYRSAAENIAMGQRSPEEVVKAWMNSAGHRKNILSSSYTHIGVGHVAEGNYWTQMFIGK